MAARKPGSSNRIAALHRRLSAHPRTAACGLLLAAPAAVLAATLVLSNLPRVGRITARAELVDLGATFLGEEGVVLQESLNDCGPAALANALRVRGMATPSLDSLAVLAGTGPAGTRASGLIRAGAELGLPLTLDRVLPERAAQVPRPFIAWVNRNHFVTVTDLTPGGILTVLDPRVGRYSISETDFLSIWSGEALLPTETAPGHRDETRHGPKHQNSGGRNATIEYESSDSRHLSGAPGCAHGCNAGRSQ